MGEKLLLAASPYWAAQPDAAWASTQESVFPQPASKPVSSAVDTSTINRRNTAPFLGPLVEAHVRVTVSLPRARVGFPAMTTMWGAPLHKRWRGSRLRDPRQAKFLTLASLRWVIANRAYTPWYLVRYWRLLKFKLANPHIITRGMVFLGKGVEIQATPELSQMEIGRWVHIGDKNTIRCHEGSLRIGDKVVLGRDNVINTYLDIELGDSVLMADWCYVCDFDHRMDDITVPIKDQGIIKGPVRIGPDTWVAAKVTVLRNTTIGRGCVLGSHAVVKGDIPDYSIAVGAPAKVVKNRQLAWETSAAQRAELAAALADIERKKAAR
jgi:acetyltransferase-like isoleucine patch superfamily enzyme